MIKSVFVLMQYIIKNTIRITFLDFHKSVFHKRVFHISIVEENTFTRSSAKWALRVHLLIIL